MARHPLEASGAVELAVLERSGFDESRHLAAGVVVDADGAVLHKVGDATASIYPRSTMKPFQALAIRRSGARFENEEYALTTASHVGTPRHLAAVQSMLVRFGNDERELLCPAAFSLDPPSARLLDVPTPLAMECSGKHAGMLGACRVNGWDTASYLDPSHPMQRAVVRELQDATGEAVDLIGADGCGTPVFPVTLTGLARGIAGLVADTDADARELVAVALENPWAIDGDGYPNATTIDRLRVFAKLGTEGVMVIGVPARGAVAVKIMDGSLRAGTLAALSLLAREQLVDADSAQAVIEAVTPAVVSRDAVVGRIRPGSALA
jgi:L-asparaginase II